MAVAAQRSPPIASAGGSARAASGTSSRRASRDGHGQTPRGLGSEDRGDGKQREDARDREEAASPGAELAPPVERHARRERQGERRSDHEFLGVAQRDR